MPGVKHYIVVHHTDQIQGPKLILGLYAALKIQDETLAKEVMAHLMHIEIHDADHCVLWWIDYTREMLRLKTEAFFLSRGLDVTHNAVAKGSFKK